MSTGVATKGEVLAEFEPVIGLEVHCQLRTESKAFCACPTRFGDAPNSNACPVCLGMPGTLPAFNERALELGIRLAVAVGAVVHERSVFARKNYFYTDLPKGYQISQFDQPLATGGHVDVELDDPAAPGASGETKRIGITRIHLEEDAGKSLHDASPTTTFVDFNRAGSPLVEMVSEPDFRSSAEAHRYLSSLRQLVRHLGVSDGNMEQGSLRCDCNVSVRPRGREAFGTKVELKNLNSFRSVARAIDHEIERQVELIRAGGEVLHATRLWDEQAGRTRPMRAKEMAHDYRYFPEPDLLPLVAPVELVDRVRAELPELPAAMRRRFVEEHGLTPYDAGVLTQSKAVAGYFEDVAAATGDARTASKWVQGEVLRSLKAAGVDVEEEQPAFPVDAARLAELIRLVGSGEISISAAKKVFEAMEAESAGGDAPRSAESHVDAMGLRQVSDEGALREQVRGVLAEHEKAVADYRDGNTKSFGFLVGQVMRATRGQANPTVVNEILRDELERGAS